ncbi:MAG: DUF4126 domain-containing protein [Clostridiaceae bacterium]|nr:DUF4126 domain-containing protein [Clostridiaceae bacterium]
MAYILQILIGVGLAATCGFRIFVPLLVMGIAGYSGYLELASEFSWIASLPAIIIFAVATIIEIAAYFIPYVDNLLDSISIPASVIAGIVVAASVITDMHPLLRWTFAVIAGGGVATVTSLVSNGVHGVSTVASGGGANPAVSGVESALSIVSAIVAVLVPVLAVILITIVVILTIRLMKKWKRRRLYRLSG